jgi:hypothetical protein
MAQKPGFDVPGLQWFAQKGIFLKVDLRDGEVVRRSPVAVELLKVLGLRPDDLAGVRRALPHLAILPTQVQRGVKP